MPKNWFEGRSDPHQDEDYFPADSRESRQSASGQEELNRPEEEDVVFDAKLLKKALTDSAGSPGASISNEEHLGTLLRLEKEKSRRFELILDHIPQPLLFVSPDLFIIKTANRHAATLLGIQQDGMNGMPLLLLIDRERRSAFRTMALSLLTGDRLGTPLLMNLNGRKHVRAMIGGTAVRDGDRLLGLLLTLYPMQ